MGQPIRTIRKRGAINREINESINDIMAIIMANRAAKLVEEQSLEVTMAQIEETAMNYK